jgi:hypothetical protein
MGSSRDPDGDPARADALRERRAAILDLGAAPRGPVHLAVATEAPACAERRPGCGNWRGRSAPAARGRTATALFHHARDGAENENVFSSDRMMTSSLCVR